MMKLISKIFIATMLVFFLQACSRVQVKTDYQRSTDFSQYRSFAWDSPRTGEKRFLPVNKEVRENIDQAIEQKLLGSGLVMAEAKEADLLVRRSVSKKDRSVRGQGVEDGGYLFGGDPDYGRRSAATRGEVIRRATLRVELFDTKQNKIVWSAEARAVVDPLAEKSAEVERFVTAIMKKFPR